MGPLVLGIGLAAIQHLVQPSQTFNLCSCSGRESIRKSRRIGLYATAGGGPDQTDDADKSKDEKPSVDWDNAWSSYRKAGKPSPFKIDMEKYVNRRPTRSDYPMSEEIDPLRKSERSFLRAWTDLRFTYALVGVILGLFVYMVIIVGPPPSR